MPRYSEENIMKIYRWKNVLFLTLLMAVLMHPETCYGNFTGGPLIGGPTGASGVINWTVGQSPLGPTQFQDAHATGPWWRITATELGGPSLQLDGEHLKPVPNHNGEIGATSVTVTTGPIAASGRLAVAAGTPHTNHTDTFSYWIKRTGATGEIRVKTKHISKKGGFRWSFRTSTAGRITVQGSYPTDPPAVIPGWNNKKLKNSDDYKKARKGGKVPNSPPPNNQNPTDYTITYEIGDPYSTQMKMSFLVESAGSLAEGDLALWTEHFTENTEFLVPMLFDADETLNLFVAVDLTQWLSFPTSYNIGDQLTITNGTSTLLPGFLFGTAPPLLGPNGYESSALFTGDAIILAEADGIPEPSTIVLFGLSGLVLLRRRRG